MADAARDVGGSTRAGSTLVAAGIFLSRIAGFIRERAIGHFLGTSAAAEAFYAAFRIPNLLQNLLGEGVLSASFIPVYARLLDEGEHDEAAKVAGAVLGLLTLTAGAVVLAIVLGADLLAGLVAAGYSAGTQALAADLMRIVAPGIGLLVISAWCLGVLNSHRRFFLSYVAPVVWNLAQVVVLVGAGFWLLERITAPDAAAPDTLASLARALAIGTLIGGLLQVLVQLPSVRRLGGRIRPSLDTSRPGVQRALKAFVPVVAGRGVVQIMTLVDVALASFLVAGALTAITKAQLLFFLPISLFGMSVAAAELPELSTARAQERDALADRLDAGLQRIAFFVVPTIVGYVVLGDFIVGALYRTGSFDRQDVLLVWITLLGFCVGLVANTASRLLQSALYGAGETRAPAVLAVLRVLLSALLGYLLMVQLDRVVLDGGLRVLPGASLPAITPLPQTVRDTSQALHLGAAGLTAAAGLAAWIEFRLLRELLELRVRRPIRPGGPAMRRILAAGAVATVVAVGVRLPLTGLHPIAAAVLSVPIVGAAYVLVGRWLGLREAEQLLSATRRRLPW